jgi:hypothetical protein
MGFETDFSSGGFPGVRALTSEVFGEILDISREPLSRVDSISPSLATSVGVCDGVGEVSGPRADGLEIGSIVGLEAPG